MDPLSITSGVVGLLTVCVNVGTELKKFHDGAVLADTTIKSLATDVESFTHANLTKSINDGQETLSRLQKCLDGINKTATFLDGPRKHLRLKAAAEEIALFQREIHSYRDTLQLSLQTVILWNQVTLQTSAEKILPSLDELHLEIRRVAFEINIRIQSAALANTDRHHMTALKNLKSCCQSAATVVSSASTTLGGGDQPSNYTADDGSVLDDVINSEPSEAMLRWISSNVVDESDELIDASSANEVPNAYYSDSDNDLDAELIHALMKRGKEKLSLEDFTSAERIFTKCLTRISGNGSLQSSETIRPQVNDLLLETYRQQQKWHDAQQLLMEILAAESRNTKAHSRFFSLSHMVTLVDVLFQKEDYSEACLYGRRALKGYRKLGSEGQPGVQESLEYLVRISHALGDFDEEDAYASILSDFLNQVPPTESTIDGKQRNTEPVEAIGTMSLHPNKAAKTDKSMSDADARVNELALVISRPNSTTAETPRESAKNSSSELPHHWDEDLTPREDSTSRMESDARASTLTDEVPLSERHASTRAAAKPPDISIQQADSGSQNAEKHDKDDVSTVEIISRNRSLLLEPSVAKIRRKLVFVGDSRCGKTLLVMVLARGTYPEIYPPTVYENYVADVQVDGKHADIAVWDTCGLSDYDRLRPLSYPDSHCVLICFAIDAPASLENVLNKWLGEVSYFCPGLPILLVGLKKDLRYDQRTIEELAKSNERPVSISEGEEVARKIGAFKYLECSSRTSVGVRDVFEAATRASLLAGQKKSRRSMRRLLGIRKRS